MRRVVNHLGYETGVFTFDRKLVRNTPIHAVLWCEGNFARKLEREINGMFETFKHIDFWPYTQKDAQMLYACDTIYYKDTDALYEQIEELIQRIRYITGYRYHGMLACLHNDHDISLGRTVDTYFQLEEGLIPEWHDNGNFSYMCIMENVACKYNEHTEEFSMIVQILMSDEIIPPPVITPKVPKRITSEDGEQTSMIDEVLAIVQKNLDDQ
jgi:hypothetical protein